MNKISWVYAAIGLICGAIVGLLVIGAVAWSTGSGVVERQTVPAGQYAVVWLAQQEPDVLSPGGTLVTIVRDHQEKTVRLPLATKLHESSENTMVLSDKDQTVVTIRPDFVFRYYRAAETHRLYFGIVAFFMLLGVIVAVIFTREKEKYGAVPLPS